MQPYNLSELQISMCQIWIRFVLNGKDIVLSHTHLQVCYTELGHWQELIVVIDIYGGLKVPYILTLMFNVTLN